MKTMRTSKELLVLLEGTWWHWNHGHRPRRNLWQKGNTLQKKRELGHSRTERGQRLMRIIAVVRKCIAIFKKMEQKIMFKIQLWEMDLLWEYMGGICWGMFPPSFCYTHTEEEIERITTNKKTQYQGTEKQRAGVYSICTFQYNGNSSDYMLLVWITGRLDSQTL